MEINALRIGNLVYGVSERIEKITSIVEDQVKSHPYMSAFDDNWTNIKHIEPIKITKEKLIELGFYKCNDMDMWYSIRILNDWTLLLINPMHSMAEISINRHGCVLQFDGNLHSLQNLYFSLTGVELL